MAAVTADTDMWQLLLLILTCGSRYC